jgi:putative ABC transport system ATP-binding protein
MARAVKVRATAATTAAATAIELRGVRRAFVAADLDSESGRTDALVGIDLAIAQGELVALTGPSGSGKSTLLHLAGALDVPTEGEVLVEGQRVGDLNAAGRARLRNRTIGFVFQAFHLAPGLTVAENVALPAVLARRPPAEVRARVADLLELVDLSARADRRPGQLSGGEQQRAAVARALVMDPPIVLADEPTGNLDSRAGGLVIDLLLAAHHAGRTVVIATHEQRLAARTERVVHLRDGSIAHETRPSRRDDRAPADLLDTRLG